MPVQPNWIVTIGAAKEVTWGTPVVPPTVFFSSSAPVFTEKQVPIFDRGLRGIRSQTQSMTFGAAHTEMDIPGMPWYGDDSGHLLMAMMGTDTVTGGLTKSGTIAAAIATATTLTYTLTGGSAPVAGDSFRVVDATNGNQVITPSVVTGAGPYTLTVPALPKAITAASVASQLNVHTITMLNTAQPPSYTVMKYDALIATARQIAGVYFEQVDIKFASTAGLTIDAKARGKLGVAATNVAATYSPEPFNVPWQAVFTVAGSANAKIVDFSVSLKAVNDQIFGMSGTQSPTAAISDQIAVTGSFTIVPQDYSEFQYYLSNTQPSVSILLDNGNTQTTFQMTKVALTDPTTFAHSGNYSTLTASYEAISNSTDGLGSNAPFKAILKNLHAAY